MDALRNKLSSSRLMVCAIAASALVGLAACGGGGDSPSPTPPPTGGGSPSPSPSPSPVPSPTPTPTPTATPTPTPTASPSPSPTPSPTPVPTALEIAQATLKTTENFFKNPLPDTGALRYGGRNDSCYLANGRTLGWLIDDYNADVAQAKASQAFNVGLTYSNISVLAERNSTNTDGSARREIDIRFDASFTDSTKAEGATETIIYGSSAGSCATPDVRNEWRFFGNRRMVGVSLQHRNTVEDLYALATGAAATPAQRWRRDIRFNVTDPMGNADYVIVTGPGPQAAGGKPFSLKLLSPRIARDAAELQGKTGNANWRDTDTFRWCNLAAGVVTVPDAEVADCVTNGVGGDNWGFNTTDRSATALATADTNFANQGWTAGGVYTFAAYKDDGWKTVNGQVGKTPIATYTVTLEALPHTFAAMDVAIAGSTESRYGGYTSSTQTTAQVADALKNAGVTSSMTWAKATPPAGGKPMGLAFLYVFGQGAKVGNAAGANFPRIRQLNLSYPASTATAADVLFNGKPTDMQTKTYAESALEYSDRNGGLIRSILVFQ